jgi:transcriptional regulator
MNGGSGVYIPEAFREQRPEVLRAFIERHPLGAMICTTADGFVANHIPMMLTGGGDSNLVLRGHVARANPVWKSVAPDTPVLVIFGGANHYITPSWYPAKQEHGKVVPTWNYAVVHAHGSVRFADEKARSLEYVSELTNLQEASREAPWKVSDAPAPYVDSMLSGIVTFEITVNRLVGKFKASQHRSEAERQAVVGALEAEGTSAADRLEVIREPARG